MKIMCASIETEIADCYSNFKMISEKIHEANANNIDLLVFPELCITGYSCGDIFYNSELLDSALQTLLDITELTRDLNFLCLVGLPIVVEDHLYNTAAVLYQGKILGIVPKLYLANTGEYYEKRWFESGLNCRAKEIRIRNETVPFGQLLIFEDIASKFRLGVELCEDMWAPVSVSDLLTVSGANVIVNLSASNETVHKYERRSGILRTMSYKQKSIYIYCSGGMNESTTDVIYSDYKAVFSKGNLVCETKFTEADSKVIVCETPLNDILAERRKSYINHNWNTDAYPQSYRVAFCKENWNGEEWRAENREPFLGSLSPSLVAERTAFLQQKALLKKMQYMKRNKIVIGVSGGLDSAAALLSCAELFSKEHIDLKNIIGVSMPGPGTTERSRHNALELMEKLHITAREISIKETVECHLKNIGQPKELFDITYEQTQSRERTKILMDLANKENAVVIGTGDMSEFALGWMTYSGDHISMYAMNCGIPKTVIIHMLEWYTETLQDYEICSILKDILNTPVSPELLPLDKNGEQKQSTEHLVGPYLVHDYFLYHFISDYRDIISLFHGACCTFPEYSKSDIKHWLKIFITRFFTRQFKRSCFSDGVQVFDIGLSPRGYWRMPSDVSPAQMLNKLQAATEDINC